MATVGAQLPRAAVARRFVARRLRSRRSIGLALVLGPPLLWMIGLYLAPLIYLLITSFWQVINYQLVQQWTLTNYKQIFSDPVWTRVLFRTVVMATLVTLT